MSASTPYEVTVTVDPAIVARLSRLEGRAYVNLLRRSTRQNAKPTLAAARRRVPVKTGKLARSLEIKGYTAPGGIVGAMVVPRLDAFSFKDSLGFRRIVKGVRQSKLGDRLEARFAGRSGVISGGANPWRYALAIETGHFRSGKKARKTPAWFLRDGLRETAPGFMSAVAYDVYQFAFRDPITATV